MENQDDWRRILLYILKSDSPPNVSKVRNALHIHPEIFHELKEKMAKKGLIKAKTKNWKIGQKKRGRAQTLLVTAEGINWLANNFNSAIQDLLSDLSQAVSKLLHNTNAKESFRKRLSEIAKGEDFELAKQNATDFFKPFKDLLKNIVVLQLWLQFNNNAISGVVPWMQLLRREPPESELTREEAEYIVENNYFLFGPDMKGYLPLPHGAQMEVAYAQKTWNWVDSLKPKDRPLEPEAVPGAPVVLVRPPSPVDSPGVAAFKARQDQSARAS